MFGGVINESYQPGWYNMTPDMFLRKGRYLYCIKYESNVEGCAVWLSEYLDRSSSMYIQDPPISFFEGSAGIIWEQVWVDSNVKAAFRLNYPGTGEASIIYFSISETPAAARMNLFFTILSLMAANFLLAIYCYNKKHAILAQKKYVFAILVLISVFASYPLFVDYAIEGHDFYFHITRIEGIKEGLLNGQFPVRINPVFFDGYGYANPVFYGEVFLYLPAFLRMIGFSLEICYNTYVMLINVFTCFGSYYCFRRMFPSFREGALACTVLYTMSPYRLMDVYLRSAVGEYTAMAFLPFVAYGVYRIYTEEREYRWCFLPLAVGMTGIIQSHILTGEMVGIILLFVCILLLKRTLKKERFFSLLKAAFIVVGVNLWFLVPFVDFALTQDVKVFNSASKGLIQSSGLFITQLISLFQKHVRSISLSSNQGITHEMPLTLGMPLVLGIGLCVVMLTTCAGDFRKEKQQASFIIILTTLLLWMTTIYFPWDKIAVASPFLRGMTSSLQYVWRFLAPATLLAVIITGYGLLLLRSKEGRITSIVVSLILCVLVVLSGMQFMQESVYEERPVRIKSMADIDTYGAAMGEEYLPIEADEKVMRIVLEPSVVNGEISSYEKNGTNVSFTVVNADDNCFILIPLLNYKGYTVSSEDGSIMDGNLSSGDSSMICIDIPAYFTGEIIVRYREAWYWRLAEVVSIFTVLIVAMAVFWDWRRQNCVE